MLLVSAARKCSSPRPDTGFPLPLAGVLLGSEAASLIDGEAGPQNRWIPCLQSCSSQRSGSFAVRPTTKKNLDPSFGSDTIKTQQAPSDCPRPHCNEHTTQTPGPLGDRQPSVAAHQWFAPKVWPRPKIPERDLLRTGGGGSMKAKQAKPTRTTRRTANFVCTESTHD